MSMEGTASWVSFTTRLKEIGREREVLGRHGPIGSRSFQRNMDQVIDSDEEEGCKVDHLLCVDAILPDDLLEKILCHLPIASIFRARTVCKRWNAITVSRKFMSQRSKLPAQKPWYFMFTNSEDPSGLAYDPSLKKWYNFSLPCIDKSGWLVASCFGLVCFMDNPSRNSIYVCNPITKSQKRLPDTQELKTSDYSALAVTVDRGSFKYMVAVARSKQIPHDFLEWNLSIEVYDSSSRKWSSPACEVLHGWRGGDEGVICNGVFYILIYSTANNSNNRHGLITYDLASTVLRVLSIRMPCYLTCGRLMNLRECLLMVGGIGKPDRPDIIKGIGIWEFKKGEWHEVGRMPHKFFQGFGEFDEVFSSSGTDDLIYIQSYGAPALLVFDRNHKTWRWSQKCPINKRFPLQLFTGFCFEPRLEIEV